MSAERGGGFGGWREILVEESDLPAARQLLTNAGDKPPVVRLALGRAPG